MSRKRSAATSQETDLSDKDDEPDAQSPPKKKQKMDKDQQQQTEDIDSDIIDDPRAPKTYHCCLVVTRAWKGAITKMTNVDFF